MGDQVLNKNQMQELVELGIDTSKASCVIDEKMNIILANDRKIIDVLRRDIIMELTLTFTLQDILSLLPEELPVRSKTGFTYFINITASKSKSFWVISYEDVYDEEVNGIKLVGTDWLHVERDESLLTACFSMLKWCKQNKYI